MVPNDTYHINWPGKSGHLDNQDTFIVGPKGVHNTMNVLLATAIWEQQD